MKPCEAREADCRCNRTARHKIHRCDCGGAWVYDKDGHMLPRLFPGGDANLFDAIERLFGPTGFLR